MQKPRVEIETTKGSFIIELAIAEAPVTTANFLAYVDAGHYTDTLFHRVIDGFMVQGGGYATTFARMPTREPVKSEADNGLANLAGTVAMARTGDPHSATAQFFVNLADNAFLDHTAKTDRGWGYTVFGRVVAGMETIDAIRRVATGAKASFAKDVPLEDVVIRAARRV